MVEMCLISAEYPNGLIILKDKFYSKRIDSTGSKFAALHAG